MPAPSADDLARRVERFAEAWALWAPGERIAVAVSGGLDSVVLVRLLHRLGLDLVVFHAHHGLRGAASDADAASVQALARALALPCEVREVPVEGENVQAAARRGRYALAAERARAHGAAAVATAHHADDLAETVLMHLARGAGPAAQGGIPVSRPLGDGLRVVRPLLSIPKADLRACAELEGWAWREDLSNASAAYRRNRLRAEVLPVLQQEYGPEVAQRIAAGALEQQRFVRAVMEPVLAKATQHEDGALALAALARQPAPVVRAVCAEALRRWAPGAARSAALLDQVVALVDAPPGQRAGPFWRDRDAIRMSLAEGGGFSETMGFSEEGAAAGGWAVIPGQPLCTPWGTLHMGDAAAEPDPSDPYAEQADAQALVGPLVLRPWRAGDRMRPLGLGGSKLVSDLLTDRKVPPSERARQLVLVRREGGGDEVLWLVGHRLDDRARITPKTRQRVGLRWEPKP